MAMFIIFVVIRQIKWQAGPGAERAETAPPPLARAESAPRPRRCPSCRPRRCTRWLSAQSRSLRPVECVSCIREQAVLWQRVCVRCPDGDRSMVNYVNPLAMYQGKSGQYGGGWYGWQHQNFEEQQWCTWNGAPAGGEWAPDPHHFPKREPGDREITDIPSPARGDLASPGEGSPGSRPAQPPAPPRSPYEWMKKPNYQTQPNPGTY